MKSSVHPRDYSFSSAKVVSRGQRASRKYGELNFKSCEVTFNVKTWRGHRNESSKSSRSAVIRESSRVIKRFRDAEDGDPTLPGLVFQGPINSPTVSWLINLTSQYFARRSEMNFIPVRQFKDIRASSRAWIAVETRAFCQFIPSLCVACSLTALKALLESRGIKRDFNRRLTT